MAISPEIIQKHLEQVEAIAEEILSDQQEIITLDKRRNLNREALRQLKSNPKCQLEPSKTWVCVGNMFMRLPKKNVMDSIEKEQTKVDTEIRNLRNGLRNKVNDLNVLEGKEITRGTGLAALTKEEWGAVKQVLGTSSC